MACMAAQPGSLCFWCPHSPRAAYCKRAPPPGLCPRGQASRGASKVWSWLVAPLGHPSASAGVRWPAQHAQQAGRAWGWHWLSVLALASTKSVKGSSRAWPGDAAQPPACLAGVHACCLQGRVAMRLHIWDAYHLKSRKVGIGGARSGRTSGGGGRGAHGLGGSTLPGMQALLHICAPRPSARLYATTHPPPCRAWQSAIPSVHSELALQAASNAGIAGRCCEWQWRMRALLRPVCQWYGERPATAEQDGCHL